MNIESQTDETQPLTVGQKLRQAREQRGLSQKDIADNLCLRQTIINDIEEDANPSDLAPTFVRGYIRAYAKFINLPEDELLDEIVISDKIAPTAKLKKESKELRTAAVKDFPLNKLSSHKKKDSWLMLLTWLILLIVIGLSGVWWWQNYRWDTRIINDLDISSRLKLNEAQSEGRIIPLDTQSGSSGSNVIVLPSRSSSSPTMTSTSAETNRNDSVSLSAMFQQRQALFPNLKASLTAEAIAQLKVLANTVHMSFTGKSWVTISHRINGRNVALFSGQKNNGDTLEVSGTPPYRITLGNPNAVSIELGGKPVPAQARFVLNANAVNQ